MLRDVWLHLDRIFFVFATWKIEGTRKCPEGRESTLQQHHQPNSWHSTLQETSAWLSVRNSCGLTRQTHFTEGKVGEPSAVRLARIWNPKPNNSGLTSMSSASIYLLRPKLFKISLSEICAQPCLQQGPLSTCILLFFSAYTVSKSDFWPLCQKSSIFKIGRKLPNFVLPGSIWSVWKGLCSCKNNVLPNVMSKNWTGLCHHLNSARDVHSSGNDHQLEPVPKEWSSRQHSCSNFLTYPICNLISLLNPLDLATKLRSFCQTMKKVLLL